LWNQETGTYLAAVVHTVYGLQRYYSLLRGCTGGEKGHETLDINLRMTDWHFEADAIFPTGTEAKVVVKF